MKSLNRAITEPDFPIDRSNLVEASAGTGKTYSLQTLFLRLVVEHGYRVGEILTVTFTEAATRELRDRLRAVLRECLLAIDGNDGSGDCDRRIQDILDLPARNIPPGQHDEEAVRKQRVLDALGDFDQAAIFTIHGFCHRALSRYAFECAHDFGAELTENRNDWLAELCEDWWRRTTCAQDELSMLMMLNSGITLGRLKEIVSQRISRPYALLVPDADQDVPGAQEIMGRLRAMIAAWNRETVLQALDAAKVSRGKLRDVARNRIADTLDSLKAGKPAAGIALLEKFTPDFFAQPKALKKDSPGPPADPFFAKCAEFLAVFMPALSRFVSRTVTQVIGEYDRKKHLQRTLSYDDLLLNLQKALMAPGIGEQLLESLRGSYRVLLIDEFQDTDPVQYRIFRTVFLDCGMPVFMVGDPKQAIYAFRGGDIFTYYAAAAKVDDDRKYALTRNWRSEARLVDAINLIFRDHGGRVTFINENIRYPGNIEPEGKLDEKSLKIRGRIDAAPLKLWNYTDVNGKPPAKNSSATFRIYRDVADEIARLLNDRELKIRGRSPMPSDFAILVLAHDEARDLAAELRKRDIPVVIQKSGKIFKSREADDMRFLLMALLNPGRVEAVCTALATGFFPCSDQRIRAMLEQNTEGFLQDQDKANDLPSEFAGGLDAALSSMEDWLELFNEAHSLWRSGSFLQAFSFLSLRSGMKPHLVSTEDGERRLTNLLQLVHLINRAAIEEKVGMDETLTWFQAQCMDDGEDDAPELRLESDDDAVRIMTIFKSKGLEFPVVFVPCLWRRNLTVRHSGLLRYHAREDDRMAVADNGEPRPCILDLRTDNNDAKNCVRDEMREENIRLFYVAVTRAVHRCYVVWGNFGGESPLADVLGTDVRAMLAGRWQGRGEMPVEVIDRSIAEAPAPVMHHAVSGRLPVLMTADERFGHAGFAVDKSYGHTSFSGLAPHTAGGIAALHEKYDFDHVAAGAGEPEDEPAADGIFAFPAGARTGNCWHDIFERIDFQADHAAIRAVVAEEMARYGFYRGDDDSGALELVCNMVQEVVAAPLPVEPVFSLKDIAVADRRSEMDFAFCLTARDEKLTTSRILAILQKHWRDSPQQQVFLDRLAGWDRPLPRGFLTGAVDLVFRREQRYYIVDWKSNRIDGRQRSFAPEHLGREMAENAYFLQYLIYTVAVHNYLVGSLDGYSYDRHMGGVFYVFLRGVGRESGQGIYFARPAEALIHDLSELFGVLS